MKHPYYNSDHNKYKKRLSYIVLFFSLITFFTIVIIIPLIMKWEDSQIDYEDGFIDYEVIIWNDHDVMLYNTNDVTDSIHLRLENTSNLHSEWMIQVHK